MGITKAGMQCNKSDALTFQQKYQRVTFVTSHA